jgi:hypothetical protein
VQTAVLREEAFGAAYNRGFVLGREVFAEESESQLHPFYVTEVTEQP